MKVIPTPLSSIKQKTYFIFSGGTGKRERTFQLNLPASQTGCRAIYINISFGLF
jgi:hypothetical protein